MSPQQRYSVKVAPGSIPRALFDAKRLCTICGWISRRYTVSVSLIQMLFHVSQMHCSTVEVSIIAQRCTFDPRQGKLLVGNAVQDLLCFFLDRFNQHRSRRDPAGNHEHFRINDRFQLQAPPMAFSIKKAPCMLTLRTLNSPAKYREQTRLEG